MRPVGHERITSSAARIPYTSPQALHAVQADNKDASEDRSQRIFLSLFSALEGGCELAHSVWSNLGEVAGKSC